MKRLSIELIKESGVEVRYRVIDVIFNDQTHQRSGRHYCYSIPDEGIRIRNAIADGRKLVIEEDKLEKIVTLEDFKKVELNTFQEKKMAKLSELYKRVNERLVTVTGLTLYSFFSDMVRLAAHGHFITDKNREETYLNIVDTADEDLIECLETYLDSKDKVDEVTNFHRKATKFIRNLEKAETDEEIKTALDDYEEFGIY